MTCFKPAAEGHGEVDVGCREVGVGQPRGCVVQRRQPADGAWQVQQCMVLGVRVVGSSPSASCQRRPLRRSACWVKPDSARRAAITLAKDPAERTANAARAAMGAVDRLVTVRIPISKFHRSFTALPRATERKDRSQSARTNMRVMFLGWQRRRGWLTPTWRGLGRCCGLLRGEGAKEVVLVPRGAVYRNVKFATNSATMNPITV